MPPINEDTLYNENADSRKNEERDDDGILTPEVKKAALYAYRSIGGIRP